MVDRIKATLVRSPIGRCRRHKDTVAKLGFKRLNQTIIKDNRPEILGMLKKVSYLVQFEPFSDEEETTDA
ncbi:MAG: 50S ribosomal protein L30 [Candidatus Coatesbacteria bacterium]|nr:50S ribosomal protein L30 [Candidatus Coatesbacteria bacterium]